MAHLLVKLLFDTRKQTVTRRIDQLFACFVSFLPFLECSCPMDIQSGRFQGRRQSHLRHPSDAKMLESGYTIKVGHGPFYAGTITILFCEGGCFLLFSASGETKGLGVIADGTALFITFYRTLRLIDAGMCRRLLCQSKRSYRPVCRSLILWVPAAQDRQ